MDLEVVRGELKELEAEAVAVPVFEDLFDGFSSEFDSLLGGELKRMVERGEFKPELGKEMLLFSKEVKAKRVLVLGAGKSSELTFERVMQVAGNAAKKAKELGVESFGVAAPYGDKMGMDGKVKAMAEGMELALYSFGYKKEEKEVKRGVILVKEGEFSKELEEAKVIADAVKFARDVSNTPSNEMYPEKMAEVAKGLEGEGIRVKVLKGDELKGMGGLLAVGNGSERKPRLIVMEYRGGEGEFYALVGKGITFDSGGISIKPSERMEEMKYDKSGGAVVMGIMKAIAKLKLPINVVGVVPAAENMPSGASYRPGDVIRFYNGKTAEIINTDAEGRLILADALAYAVKNYNPKLIIDFATLTGACVIALGTKAAGLFTNRDEYAEKLSKLGDEIGERVWRLPLWDEYYEQIKSEIADLKNVGGRPAGAITAAAFLSKFVDEKPWVHLDIAGVAWTQETSTEKSYIPKGATGFGVRLAVEFLKSLEG